MRERTARVLIASAIVDTIAAAGMAIPAVIADETFLLVPVAVLGLAGIVVLVVGIRMLAREQRRAVGEAPAKEAEDEHPPDGGPDYDDDSQWGWKA